MTVILHPDCYVCIGGRASMDKVMVITGGGRGIGAATALLAAGQGYRICINYQSDEQAAQSVLEQVRALGAQAIAVCAPMSALVTAPSHWFHRRHRAGTVTALVNNAGTVGHKSRVDEMSEFRILKIMKTNVLAPILCAKHAILRMSPKHGGQGGSIVNVPRSPHAWARPTNTSTMPRPKVRSTPSPSVCPRKWRARVFRVNAVRPGYIYTDFHALKARSGSGQQA